jgi:hypothetical protein
MAMSERQVFQINGRKYQIFVNLGESMMDLWKYKNAHVLCAKSGKSASQTVLIYKSNQL